MTEPATTSTEPWSIGRLLTWTRDYFQSKGLDEPRLAAELLLAKTLECRKIELYTRFDLVPAAEQLAAFRTLVKAAAADEPIAYLIGHKEFYSLDIEVTPAVLIPRPETELLVELALAWCREHPRDRYDILDVGTGSGCIGVTLAVRQSAALVVATDCSAEALAVAGRNADRHGVGDRVQTVEADMLSLGADVAPTGGFDIVVSNPPYVAESRPESLAEDVRRYEPATALFAGPDGLEAFRRIAADVDGLLRQGGTVIVEIGRGQEDDVQAIMAETAGLTCVGRHRDLAGIIRGLQFERHP